MINEKDLDTIIDAVTWSYEECGDKVPQNILDTLNKIKQIFKNQSNPTLDECIKEWEKLGYSYHKYKKDEWEHERIRFYNDGTFIVISLNDFSYYKASYYADNEGPLIYKRIKFEEHILLTKTLKALEVENEKIIYF